MVIIKDNYAVYQNKVAASQQDINGGYLVATATKWRNDSVNNAMQFLKMQLIWATLPGKIRHVVAQKDQTNITLDDKYQIATTVQRESGPHTSETITAVKEENCYYCKIQNHRQEECRKRICENEPCKDRHGRAYWPKSYVMDTSSEKNEQKGQQPVFHLQD